MDETPGKGPRLIDILEPALLASPANDHLSDLAALASIAVSLKRIADALWGIEGTAGLLHLLNPLDVRNNY
jgi:hypothetical protein